MTKFFWSIRASLRAMLCCITAGMRDGNNFITEDMTEVYDGIYVKTFVMFFGEMIKYYVSEESGNKVEVTEGKKDNKQ